MEKLVMYTLRTERSVRCISPLPGNICDVCVFHDAQMFEEFKGKGFGAAENMNAIWQAHGWGFRYAICTVNMLNKPQIRIMVRNKWTMIGTFANGEGEGVGLFGRPTEEFKA